MTSSGVWSPRGRERGPLALLATYLRVSVAAGTYAMLGSPKRKIELFGNRDEADRWLTAQTA